VNTPPFDPLVAFFQWWMVEFKGGLPPCIHDGITRVGDYTGLVLYRQPPFQVELWILPPNTAAPEHAHPNVDIFLVHVTGELRVWVGEDMVLKPEDTLPLPNGVTKTNGNFIRIRPGQNHRAETGALGAAFLNVQLWIDGKPRSTDSDWKGDALNEEHKKKLTSIHAAQYVKSLRENSDSSMKAPGNTSEKESDTEALKVGSIHPSLMIHGRPPYASEVERSGQVSMAQK